MSRRRIIIVNEASASQKQLYIVKASILPGGNYRKLTYTATNKTFKQVIDYVCTLFGYTATYEDVAAAPWINTFSKDDNLLNLPSPFALFNLLRHRFLIYAQDDGDDEIYFRTWLDDGAVGTVGHPSLETIETFDWIQRYRYNVRVFMWRDENDQWFSYPVWATHQTYPIYDLGFIKNGEGYPTAYQSWHAEEDKRTFHLKYQDGDIIHTSSGIYQILVHEIFDKTQNPSLYLHFEAIPKLVDIPIDALPIAPLVRVPGYAGRGGYTYRPPLDIHDPGRH